MNIYVPTLLPPQASQTLGVGAVSRMVRVVVTVVVDIAVAVAGGKVNVVGSPVTVTVDVVSTVLRFSQTTL
jgi:hypothetical protein